MTLVSTPRRWRGLLTWQTPALTTRWDPWIRLGYIVFGVAFALTVVVDAFVHETITLGPGLVDEAGSGIDMLSAQLGHVPPPTVALFAALGAFVLAWNAVMTYRGYAHAEPEQLPRREILTFFALNAVFSIMLWACLAALGLAALATGHGFAQGFALVRHYTEWSTAVVARVPTLVQLPYPLPLLASIALVDLFHYGFHRLGHTRRSFWLLWHRPHHFTPYLTLPTTQPVFVAVPWFLLLSVPFQIGVGVTAKLFHSESMITEALLLRMLGQIAAVGSHNASLYTFFSRHRVLRALCAFYGEGPYHVMHHSARPEHGLVNLGSPLFCLWDRVFGTYVAPSNTRPPLGLTGSPRLHLNPLRLALSGFLQLGYELRVNRDWRTRWRIIFGGTQFTPPHSRDFALVSDA